MQHIHIGTSGWSYPQWKPDLYPRGVKAGEWLSHYARTFDSVELNGSFYRLPPPAYIIRWRDSVPPDFHFAVKAWRGITHMHKLHDCADALKQMLDIMDAFGGRADVLLFQLPPSLKRDDTLLAAFLAQLPDGLRYAFEFRHPSWFDEQVYALLEKRGASLVASHVRNWTPLPPGLPFLYVRLHGPARLYRDSYGAEFLATLAERLKAYGQDAYVYFNNTADSTAAIDNARELKRLVSH